MNWRPDLRFIIVPGLHGSGPDHWQTCWERTLSASRVVQDDWSDPDLDRWAERIASATLSDRRPAVLIAHSFGCLASVAAWSRMRSVVPAMLLVAPANPQRFGVQAQLGGVHPGKAAIVVASRNDPWLSFDEGAALAAGWGAALVDAGHAGHINADSGHVQWQEGQQHLRAAIERAGLAAPRLPPPESAIPPARAAALRRPQFIL